jgi:hypothetical protein
MKPLIVALLATLTLAACGVDGAPVKPTVTTSTTIGYNSATGPFNRTTIGIEVGN